MQLLSLDVLLYWVNSTTNTLRVLQNKTCYKPRRVCSWLDICTVFKNANTVHKDDDACSQLLSLDVLLCWVNRLRLLSLQMTTSKTATAILESLQITELVTWSISLKFPPLIWCCWPCWPIKKLDSNYIYVIDLRMTTSKTTSTAILESLQITELVTWPIHSSYRQNNNHENARAWVSILSYHSQSSWFPPKLDWIGCTI